MVSIWMEAVPFPERPRRDVGLIVGGLIERLDLDHLDAPVPQLGHELVDERRADAPTSFGTVNRDPQDLRGAR